MLIDSSLFLISFTFGIIFIIIGLIVHFFPPKKINYLYGYRTKSSMLSQERWDFAQKESFKTSILIGFLSILFGFISLFWQIEEEWQVILSIVFSLFLVLFLFVNVEAKIKPKFGI